MKTSKEYYEAARDQLARGDRTFMEIMNSGNPLTAAEIRQLAAKRPGLYSRYLPFAERMETEIR